MNCRRHEITAVPALLRGLALAGGLVTVDAMGCQKQIAREIIAADADYILALKGNQETAFDEVKRFLDEAVVQAAAPVPPGSRARTGHAPENLATLRRLALNLLCRDQRHQRGIKGQRLSAGWDHDYLLQLLNF